MNSNAKSLPLTDEEIQQNAEAIYMKVSDVIGEIDNMTNDDCDLFLVKLKLPLDIDPLCNRKRIAFFKIELVVASLN